MGEDPLAPIPLQPEPAAATQKRAGPPGWTAVLVVAGLVILAGALGTRGGADDAPPVTAATTTTAAAPPAAAGLGRVSPPPPATRPAVTTTTTRRPALAEIVPDLGAELVRIAYLDPATGRTLVTDWAAISADPAPANPAEPDPGHGRFQPGGGRFAGWDGSALTVDWWTIAAGVSGWDWHPSSAAVAWTAQPPAGDSEVLYVAADPFIPREDIVAVAALPIGSALVDWGDWGYAVAVTHERADWLVTTTILDPSGSPTATIPGSVLAAAASGALVIQGEPEAFADALSGDLIDDEATRETPTAEALPGVFLRHASGDVAPIETAASATQWYLFTPDGETLLVIGPSGREWSIEVWQLTDGTRRRSTITATSYPVGLSGDGRWLVSAGPGIIQLHDWRTGATHRIPFRLGQVVDVHL